MRAVITSALLLGAGIVLAEEPQAREAAIARWSQGPDAGREDRVARIQSAVANLRDVHAKAAEDATVGASLLELGAKRLLAGTATRRFLPNLPSGLGDLADTASPALEMTESGRCVMCEYILEVADRNIKSMPHWAHGGDGNFVGMTDFSGGIQQGAYRAYSGQYLQLEEGVMPQGLAGSGIPVQHTATGGALLEISAAKQAARLSPRGLPGAGSVARHSTRHFAHGATGLGLLEVDAPTPRPAPPVAGSGVAEPGSGSPAAVAADTEAVRMGQTHRNRGDETNMQPRTGENAEVNGGRVRRLIHDARKQQSDVVSHAGSGSMDGSGSTFDEVAQGVGSGQGSIAMLETGRKRIFDIVGTKLSNVASAASKVASNGAGGLGALVKGGLGGLGAGAAAGGAVIPDSPRFGRKSFADFNRVDSNAEKTTEFTQMFEDLMDQLDEICQTDLPTTDEVGKWGNSACEVMYQNAEVLVEEYLHGYEDFEICTKIDVCPASFFASV